LRLKRRGAQHPFSGRQDPLDFYDVWSFKAAMYATQRSCYGTTTMPAPGPLVVSADNPRYFAQPDGTCIYFQGSHTWPNFQEWADSQPATTFFDFDAYLNYLEGAGATFMRGWMFENPSHIIDEPQDTFFEPLPWNRTGPGNAADGLPRFDLTSFNQDYFDQWRDRCIAAGERCIYVSIMLFQAFSINDSAPWATHPFKSGNNINSINGDPSSTGKGFFTRTLGDSAITALQEAYVAKMIDTVNELDNILYEISNEDDTDSVLWQYHMIDYIHTYEAGLAKQHPVCMTPCVDVSGASYSDQLSSNAEAVGAWKDGTGGSWNDNITENDGTKIVILDQDHIFSMPASSSDVWTWKCFLRGNNVVHMDNLAGLNITGSYLSDSSTNTKLDRYNSAMRRAMTQTGSYAARLDLRFAVPHGDLTSTAYCLANPGSQYLTLAPSGGTFTVDLSAGLGKNFSVEWLKVSDGMVSSGSDVGGGSSSESFSSPFGNVASVLLLNERVPAEPVLQ
jgi:hypothetical protein